MQTNTDARRRFIRHPAEIPIEISASEVSDSHVSNTHNISAGGLSFTSADPHPLHQIVTMSIRITQPWFEEKAEVVWCKKLDKGYEIGIQFLNQDAVYRARMVEQVCHIEQYRKDMKKNGGKELTAQEAALEWISKYAANFPKT